MSVLHDIVYEVATREGVDPLELDPLNEVVDVDSLEALASHAEDRRRGSNSVVKFEYYGYTVEVGPTGKARITERPDKTDELSRETAERPVDTLSAELNHREDAMKNVADILAARERPFADRLDGLLEIARNVLGTESATLSYIDTGSYVFEAVDGTDDVDIHAGEIIPLEDTVCKRVVETEQALVCRNIEADAPELANSAFEVSSYIGVPVFVDGEVYGTFCFYDRRVRNQAFSDWDLAFVEVLSNWVSSELERRKRERAYYAAATDRSNVAN